MIAGNETTRNAISHALALFTANPGQRALLMDDLEARLPAAVEEVVRYATPVTWMRRNVTRDFEMLGHTYRAGDRVILYHNSANRRPRANAESGGCARHEVCLAGPWAVGDGDRNY